MNKTRVIRSIFLLLERICLQLSVSWDFYCYCDFNNSHPLALHWIFLNDIMINTIWGLTFSNNSDTINKPYIPLTQAFLHTAKLNFFLRMTDENMRDNIYFWPVWIKYQTCYLLSEQCQRTLAHHRLDWTKFWRMSVGTARLQVKADMWHLLTETARQQVAVLCK